MDLLVYASPALDQIRQEVSSAGRAAGLHPAGRGIIPLTSYHVTMAYKNPERQKAYARQWMRNRYSDPAFRRAQKLKVKDTKAKLVAGYGAAIVEFRRTGCAQCGEMAACCLDAHHLDPATKEFSLGAASKHRISVARFCAELAKCICLCSNCHRKVHAGLISLRDTSAVVRRSDS